MSGSNGNGISSLRRLRRSWGRREANGSFLGINLGWGLAVMLGIYAAAGVSGAHLNPAVTVAHYFRESRDNYPVDDGEVTYNFLRMVHLHFSPSRIPSARKGTSTSSRPAGPW